ncbi:MAG: permease, partial [Candidatus Aminicenantes bacterium]
MERLLANLLAVIRQTGEILLELLPYVVAGALVGALLLKQRKTIFSSRLFKFPTPVLIFCSALLGTISPLCTMGTVPVVIGMVGCGFPTAAGLAFLAASSIVNPQMLFIAFSTIGPALTAAQWFSGIGIGCAVGFLAMLFEKRNIAIVNKKIEIPAKHNNNCHHQRKHKGFFSNFLDQLEHVLFFVIGGALAASVINVWLPEPFLFKLFSRADSFEVAAGAALSIPMYVCGGGV